MNRAGERNGTSLRCFHVQSQSEYTRDSFVNKEKQQQENHSQSIYCLECILNKSKYSRLNERVRWWISFFLLEVTFSDQIEVSAGTVRYSSASSGVLETNEDPDHLAERERERAHEARKVNSHLFFLSDIHRNLCDCHLEKYKNRADSWRFVFIRFSSSSSASRENDQRFGTYAAIRADRHLFFIN